jgi:hypothetical protein
VPWRTNLPTLAALAAVLLGFPTEGFTSGGVEISITHAEVQLHIAGPRKRPMPGHEAEYNKSVVEWEKANQPVAVKALAAIEKVVPRYRTKLTLVAKQFNTYGLRELTSEGTSGHADTDGAPWLLTVDLDLYPGGSILSRAQFVLSKRPSKADVRAFSRDVQAAALQILGRTPPTPPTYSAYWLTAANTPPSLLLATVPLDKLTETLTKTPWSAMGWVTFRHAPALLLTTDAKQHLVRNTAGFLVANPTAAKLAGDSLALQVNGSYLPAMTVKPATRVDAVKLINTAVDPALGPDERKALQDDVDFLATLVPAIAR